MNASAEIRFAIRGAFMVKAIAKSHLWVVTFGQKQRQLAARTPTTSLANGRTYRRSDRPAFLADAVLLELITLSV